MTPIRRRLPPLGRRIAGQPMAAVPDGPLPAEGWQEAARALRPGDGRSFAVPPDKTPRQFAQALAVWAARAWGNGTYTVSTGAEAVRLSRKGGAGPPRPPEPRPAPAAVASGGMCREQAAEWLAPYFPKGMTAARLKGLDGRGAGPRRFRAGREVVYFAADLEAWLRTRFRAVGGAGGDGKAA